MTEQKQLIYNLSEDALRNWFAEQKQPAYRAKQVWTAIYKNFINHPDEISTLSKALRELISEAFDFIALDPVRTIESADRQTVKTLFKLRDGQYIEAVLMYYDERRTLCISSQSGCGMGCTFCATGQMGFRRNLSSGEIIAQVLYYARHLAQTGDQVTNIVMMGMGEPFHNFDNVMEALNRLNDPEAFGLGARRITLSTVGLITKIIAFADLNTQYNLAISLHSVDNDLRASMMPVSKKYTVSELLKACRYYVDKTSRRITFEYALIDGVNDSTEEAEALARAIRGMICHVNLIPLNPTRGFQKLGTRSDKVSAFAQVLENHNIPVTVRMRRGIEISAGCGQLASEVENGS
ncbi:MAG: 23S rRNA (adenine(2503)-C(2))-methyltransferase RlmN [Anaerolineaceae bacterium]|nr:23S rRNA (adenine(2503)-C(2))-methyltransferase RlmN [Anaerolineaceae bacterium]